MFDHRSSRAGDPQLHTHALVLNKVRCSDGRWRTLDATELFHHKKSAGIIYQAALRNEMHRRLGMTFREVNENGQADIVGVPDELLKLWSKRTAKIDADAGLKIAEYEKLLGRTLKLLGAGGGWSRPKGRPLRNANFGRSVWRPAVQQVGLPGLHFHDLRGCAATLAAIAGATTAELMHRLGHATPDVALRYQRATADRDVAVARALSELVASASIVPLKTGPDRADASWKGHAGGTKPTLTWL